jgi:hypothetical protein
LELIVPFVGSFCLYVREYGISVLQDFKGWGVLKIIPIILFIGHVAALYLVGESLFCGSCYRKSSDSALLLPSIGYAMAAFPSLFAGSVFHTGVEKMAEFMTALMGWLLMVMGAITVLALGRLS